jgi:hypothetical protein
MLNFEKRIPSMIRRYLSRFWPFLLAILTFCGTALAQYNPFFIEKYYSRGVYPWFAEFFSFFSQKIPFSLWETFWLVLLVALTLAIVLVLFRKLKFKSFILHFLQTLALIYTFFYLSWGFNYFRPKIENRTGWKMAPPVEKDFREAFDTIIDKANKNYSVLAVSEYKTIDSLVEQSYEKNFEFFDVNYPNGFRLPKQMLFSSFFAKSGISGYFGPFFNEVHVNRFVLPMEYPFVLAHEKAHQFGITEEAEANFAAYMICTTSDDKRLRYSGYEQLLSYFLAAAHRLPDRNDYVYKIDSLVIQDIKLQKKHWQSVENKTLDKVQTAANNMYLKTNHVDDGVANYGRVVSLVIHYILDQNRKTLP